MTWSVVAYAYADTGNAGSTALNIPGDGAGVWYEDETGAVLIGADPGIQEGDLIVCWLGVDCVIASGTFGIGEVPGAVIADASGTTLNEWTRRDHTLSLFGATAAGGETAVSIDWSDPALNGNGQGAGHVFILRDTEGRTVDWTTLGDGGYDNAFDAAADVSSPFASFATNDLTGLLTLSDPEQLYLVGAMIDDDYTSVSMRTYFNGVADGEEHPVEPTTMVTGFGAPRNQTFDMNFVFKETVGYEDVYTQFTSGTPLRAYFYFTTAVSLALHTTTRASMALKTRFRKNWVKALPYNLSTAQVREKGR